jgi:GntR family transcriptional regulator
VDVEMTDTAVAAAADITISLGITPAAPLLMLRRTSRLADGRTSESTVFHIRPERFDLVVRSGREAKLTG